MPRDFTFESFLRDLGTRLGAAAVVVGIFLGLGYLNRINLFGLLDNQLVFFATAFGLVGLASVAWIVFQRHRA
jgi:hypothetical protein